MLHSRSTNRGPYQAPLVSVCSKLRGDVPVGQLAALVDAGCLAAVGLTQVAGLADDGGQLFHYTPPKCWETSSYIPKLNGMSESGSHALSSGELV